MPSAAALALLWQLRSRQRSRSPHRCRKSQQGISPRRSRLAPRQPAALPPPPPPRQRASLQPDSQRQPALLLRKLRQRVGPSLGLATSPVPLLLPRLMRLAMAAVGLPAARRHWVPRKAQGSRRGKPATPRNLD